MDRQRDYNFLLTYKGGAIERLPNSKKRFLYSCVIILINEKKKYQIDLEDPLLKEILRAYSGESNKDTVSRLYKGFFTKKTYSTEYIKNKWEREGDFEMTKEEWQSYCDSQWKCTSSYTWREFAWKCLVRFFITPRLRAHYTGRDSTVHAGEAVKIRRQTIGIYFGSVRG